MDKNTANYIARAFILLGFFLTICTCIILDTIKDDIKINNKLINSYKSDNLRVIHDTSYIYIHYFDGEGNIIPQNYVNLLFKSQFIKISKSEKDSLDRVFYATKH